MADQLSPTAAAARPLAEDKSVSETDRGCVFFNFGDAYALRLLVSVYSLRRFYDGPITTFLARDAAGARLQDQLEQLGSDVVFVDEFSKSWDRHRLFLESPYTATLAFDSDLIFLAPIDGLWEPLEREGVLVTRFHPAPYGVDGAPGRPGWANRMALLEGVRGLVDADTYTEAVRRLLDERIDVNVGVMGIARPRGEAFLADLSDGMKRGQSSRIVLLDEMLTVALLPKHRHFLADEKWNCPADEFFRRTNLADARVIHYFADGCRVHGMRLGRNPATWAGRKWYAVYHEAGKHLDLKRWERGDPTFSGRLRRLFANGAGHALYLVRQEIRGKRYRLRKRGDRITRRLLRVVYLPPRQAALTVLGKLGYRVKIDSPARATVVILSYKRMNNIAAIVRSAMLCDFVDRIVVCNNNPDVDLQPYLTMRDARLQLIQQGRRRWPSYRYDVAREHPSDYYICIDDDVFPTPWQLKRMFVSLLADPDSPVGNTGQTYDARTGVLLEERHSLWSWRDQTRPVDVLLQIYVFTRKHLEKYFELLRAIGVDNEEVHSSEDVIISFTGSKRPTLKDVGEVFECATTRDPGVATHKQAGFHAFRYELYHRLSEVR
jgi:hypothetical protein